MNTSAERQPQVHLKRVSVLIPLLFVAVLWVVELVQCALAVDWRHWGVLPRTLHGLKGVVFAPVLHGNLHHLLANSVPAAALGAALIYFYRRLAYKVVLWVWLFDGLGVWLVGRPSYHIGASGLVYGMAAFLVFSGLLRSNRRLTALSLAVVFAYGGLVWGMLPYLEHLSWEGHLFGFLTGLALAVFYRGQGPSNDPLPDWMQEPDEAPNDRPSESQGSMLVVRDPAGRTLRTLAVQGQRMELNTAGLAAGIYTVTLLVNGQAVGSTQVVKE